MSLAAASPEAVRELKRYQYDGRTLRVETKLCGGDRGPKVFSLLHEAPATRWVDTDGEGE